MLPYFIRKISHFMKYSFLHAIINLIFCTYFSIHQINWQNIKFYVHITMTRWFSLSPSLFLSFHPTRPLFGLRRCCCCLFQLICCCSCLALPVLYVKKEVGMRCDRPLLRTCTWIYLFILWLVLFCIVCCMLCAWNCIKYQVSTVSLVTEVA